MKATRSSIRAAGAVFAAACALSVSNLGAPAMAADGGTNMIFVTATAKSATGNVDPSPSDVTATAYNVTNGKSYDLPSDGYGVALSNSLPDGVYKLKVSRRSGQYAPTWWPGVYSEAAAATFKLSAAVKDCNTRAVGPDGCWGLVYSPELQQLRTVTGYVRQRSGAGVAGVTVTAKSTEEPVTRFTATTQNTGQYTMSVPPGGYELSVPNGNRSATAMVDVNSLVVSKSITVLDPPTAPTNVQAAPAGRAASVKWAAPGDDGGTAITGYTATANPGGLSCTSDGALGCSINGLTNNQSYTITVVAANAVGSSPASAASSPVTPQDPVPGSPTSVRAEAGARMATVSWVAPRSGGAPATSYTVASKPGGHSCSTQNLTCDVKGLTNGKTYRFSVVAASSGGTSEPSALSDAVTPAQAPSAPRNLQVLPGNRSVMVAWNAPVDDGGAKITSYTATTYPGGRTCTAGGQQQSCVIGGLTNGAAYSVVVTASNPMGTSERSPGSVAVTPSRSAAPAVLTVTGKVTSRGVRLQWSSPIAAKSVKLRWQRSSLAATNRRVDTAGVHFIKAAPNTDVKVRVRAFDRSGGLVGSFRNTYRVR